MGKNGREKGREEEGKREVEMEGKKGKGRRKKERVKGGKA